jgi:hypothetical protein
MSLGPETNLKHSLLPQGVAVYTVRQVFQVDLETVFPMANEIRKYFRNQRKPEQEKDGQLNLPEFE